MIWGGIDLERRPLLDSFQDAVEGILHTLRTQRNMRLHYAAAGAVLMLALFFKLSKIEVLVLFFAIAMVLVAEMFNTAVEAAIDLVTSKYHPLARIAKNVAAGAVLVAAVNAIAVGYLLFFDRISRAIPRLYERIVGFPPYLTFVAIALVTLAVIVAKVYSKSAHFFRGGMPSGHTALAFSLATAMFFLTRNGLVVTLGFMLALLVGQSRVEGHVHSVIEVVFGALLGVFVTIAVFQLYLM